MTSSISLDSYRRQWPRLGAIIAMGWGGALALASMKNRLSRLQMISALNFGALLVHQYEEYEDPGYFPGQFNRGLFKSDLPDHYPLNTHTAMCINTAIAYPFYILPVVFPAKRWLGIAPVLFGISQAVGHGIIFPRIAGARYSPGFLASILLHVPLGVAYFKALGTDGPISKKDLALGIAYQAAFAAIGVAGPNVVGRDRNSRNAFRPDQVGPYAVSADS
jgi:hypothetical protein